MATPGPSPSPLPPGPPVRNTIGSGFLSGAVAGRIATASRMVRPSRLLRSSGTVRYPHLKSGPRSRLVPNSGKIGFGHGAAAYDAREPSAGRTDAVEPDETDDAAGRAASLLAQLVATIARPASAAIGHRRAAG